MMSDDNNTDSIISTLVAIKPDLRLVWLSLSQALNHDSRIALAEEQIRRWSKYLNRAMCDFSEEDEENDLCTQVSSPNVLAPGTSFPETAHDGDIFYLEQTYLDNPPGLYKYDRGVWCIIVESKA
jgi:hypothetical protein